VFDEVDAGVGGAVAEVIGRKLKEVAGHHQVLCITHLPQIAVFADGHYYVSKAVQSGRTRSAIKKLDTSAQREEIARMLGGIQITQRTRAAAAEMLRGAN
jgi:DNA repair protein RecN (Recombination protein N)